ncbi:MAG: ABC transporter permease, partial [Cyclobacteriaceae bacterium]
MYQTKIAWRNLISDLNYFLLNLLGFIIGISSFTTIMIYVNHEYSYDKFHRNHENIYRITTQSQQGTEDSRWALTNGGLVPILKEKVPEVKDAMKLFTVYGRQTFRIKENVYSVDDGSGYYVDPNFLDIFDFNLISGDKKQVLNQPNQIILTEKLALKLFRELNILGKTLIIKGQDEQNDQTLKITGVLEDLPQNSHIQFDYLISGSGSFWDGFENPKAGYPVYVYFEVHHNIDPDQLRLNIDNATKGLYPESLYFPIQKITEIYFHADNLFEHAKTGNQNFSRILIIIALFILVISIINYVLMSTSKSIQRAREVGIKKIFGVSRWLLAWQFLTETILSSVFAGILSILTIELALKYILSDWFNVSLSLFDNPYYIPFILLISILTGIFAGIFPSIRISRLNIIDIFQGNLMSKHPSKVSLRDLLVAVQFIFTITIIIGSIVVLRQLYFLKNKDLGYKKEFVINVSRPSGISNSTWNFFQETINSESRVKNVGTSLYPFIGDYNTTTVIFSDKMSNDTVPLRVQWNAINYDLIPAMDMQIVEGRNFSRDIPSDSLSIILNETAKNEIGIENIQDQSVVFWPFRDQSGRVIGVIKDYHFQTFDQKILPTIFMLHQGRLSSKYMLISMLSQDYR